MGERGQCDRHDAVVCDGSQLSTDPLGLRGNQLYGKFTGQTDLSEGAHACSSKCSSNPSLALSIVTDFKFTSSETIKIRIEGQEGRPRNDLIASECGIPV